ncbi:MAG: tetratricopeptide repeat protein [Acetobacteraceae bacterium]|nr:tetratricopeptide repeat protein [Acetobacteraceae bacterium]
MQSVSSRRRLSRMIVLLGMAAAAPSFAAVPAQSGRKVPKLPIDGAPGEYLAGRLALSQLDSEFAADAFLKALAVEPGQMDLLQQAFLACLMSNRPEAVRLARELPDNQAAQLLLGGVEAKTGNWDAAEQRFRAMPRQGLTQFLQPLLVAWAQQGAGRTDAALATLRPLTEGQRMRGIYAMHAALIADLGGRPGDAGRLYRIAQSDYGGINLRLARIVASWQARTGHPADAHQTLRALTDGNDDMSIALPALIASAGSRPVARATDGIAEAYLALAAAMRQQDQSDSSMLLLRLALNLRPDFTAARMMMAENEAAGGNPAQALHTLAPIPATDPLSSVVRLRRAAFTDRAGNSEDAERELDQLARDYPESPLPLAQLGDLLRSKNRFTDAIGAYDRAITRVQAPQRSAWPLFYARGIAEERSKDWPRAQADLERALQLSPDQPYVLNYLGYSWADQGEHLSQARQMLTRALELRPTDGSIVDSLGWLQLRQGDTKAAVQSLERAVEMMPEDATINGHLGDAYWAAGRKQEAQFQWQRALVLNPDADEAARLETKLRNYATQTEAPGTTAEHRVQ